MVIGAAENWLLSVALKKIAYMISKGIIALLVSAKIDAILKAHGVSLPISILAGLEAAHDYLRLKTRLRWL